MFTNKIASHNSWTFGKPIKWYLPYFMGRCQRVNIKEQYDLGARYFDLRFRLHNNQWVTSHGIFCFDTDFHKDLAFLNQFEDIYVRVLLEYNSEPKDFDNISKRFYMVCEKLQEQYPNIKFVSGRCKWNWNIIFDFKNEEPPLLDKYSSQTSLFNSQNKLLRKLDDWWPWLYARLKNKSNYQKFCENNNGEYLMIDFIDMIK